MCGIAGFIDPKAETDEKCLRSMLPPLVKRGPDDEGILFRETAGLAHRRLAIIDIKGGHQPILNEEATLALVCNGEIYDFKDLRRRLQQGGHSFRTGSDSEVILHLYEDKGAGCLEMLNGMFAFAILDIPRNSVFLARDRFGQKPLYYTADNHRFAFASSIQSLTALPWVSDSLDLAAVHDYLSFQYIPEPRSIYHAIKKLPAHSFAFWDKSEFDIHSYWSPKIEPENGLSYQLACNDLFDRLKQAVSRRLAADVPVGIFLSGGVDSSLVCALAREVSSEPLQTFSVGFKEDRYDESSFARKIANEIGTEHRCLEIRPDDFHFLQELTGGLDEPFADASILPAALLSRFTRSYVKTALSGDGADEMFGGYYRYRIMHLMRFADLCPEPLRKSLTARLLKILPAAKEERTRIEACRRLLNTAGSEGIRRYLQLISRFPLSLRRQLYTPFMQGAVRDCGDTELLEEFQRFHKEIADTVMEIDLATYLPNDILTKLDRASMSYGLEVRSPFLDPAVAEIAFYIPYHWKQKGNIRKRILRDTFKDTLPAWVFNRPKKGFGVPVANWLRNDWQEQVSALLLEGETVNSGLFDRDVLNFLLSEHSAGRNDYSYPLFSILILELWMRNSPFSV